jgi:hypothetical protein
MFKLKSCLYSARLVWSPQFPCLQLLVLEFDDQARAAARLIRSKDGYAVAQRDLLQTRGVAP